MNTGLDCFGRDMGSEGSSKTIEDTVGGLVWIRRRNGSWWPGRIMGLNELPQSCLLSARSGTPVKLLGREDASVDWYNLEKSKRVKAFRCGEYDECIEKAKASAASANKKAVKYARREDAILHALELESARESDGHHGFKSTGRSTCKRQGLCIRKPKKVSSCDSEYVDLDHKESTVEENLTKGLSQSGLTFEDPSRAHTVQAHCLQTTKWKTPNDSEDDGSEGTKRMRGLEDLGMGILSKGKASVHSDSDVCSDSEGSDELVRQNDGEPNVCSSITNGSPVNKSMDSCSHVRKKQVQVALAHENLKRRTRLPLTKVLESTTMVSVPVFCDQGVSPGQSSLQGGADSKASALESTDSEKTTISPVTNNNLNCDGPSCDKETYFDASIYAHDAGVDGGPILSDPKDTDISTMLEFTENDGADGLFDVPFVREKNHTQDTSRNLHSSASGRPWNHCCIVEPTSLHNGELDESGSTDHIVDVSNINPMVEKHTSKWQSKRKRNSRTQSHRISKHMHLSRCVDRESDASLTVKRHTNYLFQGFEHKGELDDLLPLDNSIHCSSREPTYLDSLSYGTQSLSNKEGIETDRMLSLPHGKSAVTKPAASMRNKELYLRDESASPLMPHRSLPYRQSRFTPHSKYQDAYVSSRSAFENSSLFDVNLEVRASYPGRHVPLVSLMSKLNGKAIVGHPVTVEACDNGYSDHLLNSIANLASSSDDLYEVTGNTSDQSMDVAGISLFQSRYGKPIGSHQVETRHVLSPVTRKKSSASPKKSSKARKCGLLSKKTRKLSSFVVSDQRDKGMKPMVEKLGGPVIACVPLNIVFSRINEALNGSARSAHRKLTSGNL